MIESELSGSADGPLTFELEVGPGVRVQRLHYPLQPGGLWEIVVGVGLVSRRQLHQFEPVADAPLLRCRTGETSRPPPSHNRTTDRQRQLKQTHWPRGRNTADDNSNRNARLWIHLANGLDHFFMKNRTK